MIVPYEDKDMYYDSTLGKYVLKVESIYKNLFLEENILNYFKGLANNKQFLVEVSEDVYRLILSYKMLNERLIYKHYVNTNELFREYLKRAMLYHVRFALRSSGNILKDMHGVDLERGRRIDLKHLRGDASFSEATIEELKQAGILNIDSVRYLQGELDFSKGWY